MYHFLQIFRIDNFLTAHNVSPSVGQSVGQSIGPSIVPLQKPKPLKPFFKTFGIDAAPKTAK